MQNQLRKEIKILLNETHSNGLQKLVKKSLFLLVLFLSSYVGYLYSASLNHLILIILSSFLLALSSLIFCLSVFHDASHGIFKSSKISQFIAFSIGCLFGISSILWHDKHVKKHHAYTNVFGKDTDIYTGGLFRLHKFDTWQKKHRFQHFYAVPLYSLLLLKWIYFDDFHSIIINRYHYKRKKYFLCIGEVLLTRITHILFFLVLPSFYFSSLSYQLYSYLIIQLTMGVILSIIFQLAHINNKTTFHTTSDAKNENHFLDQLSSTADFAPDNKFMIWVTGGLNMQVVHHLFPYITHMNYSIIQPLVKLFCQKHGLQYNEYPSFFLAFKEHLYYLKSLSKPN